MRLVNCSQHLLHTADSIAAPSETANPTAKYNFMLSWLPGTLLVVAIIAIALLGSPTKPQAELDWLSKLANNGDAGAQLQLGLAYREGRYGLTPDAKAGLFWLKKSASAGNAFAEDAIANAYASGQGTKQDAQQAEQWWRKAIKDGDRNAKVHLANELFQTGHTQEADQLFM